MKYYKMPATKDNCYKVQQWGSSASKVEFPNPPKASGVPVLIDVNRHCQTLILLKHKSVRLSSLANWDEMNATPLHATRAVALTALMHLLGTWCAPVFKLTFTQATHHAVWIVNIKMNYSSLGPTIQQHILPCKQQLWSTLKKSKMLIRSSDYTEDS